MKRLVTIVCIDIGGAFILKYVFDEDGWLAVEERKVFKSNPVTRSICAEFESAGYYEREVHEMFGVIFEGNPDLKKRLFLPDDGVRTPLRRRNKNA